MFRSMDKNCMLAWRPAGAKLVAKIARFPEGNPTPSPVRVGKKSFGGSGAMTISPGSIAWLQRVNGPTEFNDGNASPQRQLPRTKLLSLVKRQCHNFGGFNRGISIFDREQAQRDTALAQIRDHGCRMAR
jgi:hypothetical protein